MGHTNTWYSRAESLFNTTIEFFRSCNPKSTAAPSSFEQLDDTWSAWSVQGGVWQCYKYPWLTSTRTGAQGTALLTCMVPAVLNSNDFLSSVQVTYGDAFAGDPHLVANFGLFGGQAYVTFTIGDTHLGTSPNLSGPTCDEDKWSAAESYISDLINSADIARKFHDDYGLSLDGVVTLPMLVLDAIAYTGIQARKVMRS